MITGSRGLADRIWHACLVLGLGLLPALGCGPTGPELFEVSGRVTLDGEPLSRGIVKFVPTMGVQSVGPVDQDGRFVMKYRGEKPGVVPGTHRVVVYAGEVLSETEIRWHAPKAYAYPATTPLTEVVEAANDNFEIELTWGDASGPYVERS